MRTPVKIVAPILLLVISTVARAEYPGPSVGAVTTVIMALHVNSDEEQVREREDQLCVFDVKKIDSGEIVYTIDFNKLSKHYAVDPTYSRLVPGLVLQARVTVFGQFGAVCRGDGVCNDELSVTLGRGQAEAFLRYLRGTQSRVCPPYDAPRRP
jgi:hypothetical protein